MVFEGAFQNIVGYTAKTVGDFFKLRVRVWGEISFYHAEEVTEGGADCSSSCYNPNGRWAKGVYTTAHVRSNASLERFVPNDYGGDWREDSVITGEPLLLETPIYDVGFTGAVQGNYTGGIWQVGLLGYYTNIGFHREETSGREPIFELAGEKFYAGLYQRVVSSYGTVCLPGSAYEYLGACIAESHILVDMENVLDLMGDVVISGRRFKCLGATSHSSLGYGDYPRDLVPRSAVYLLLQEII